MKHSVKGLFRMKKFTNRLPTTSLSELGAFILTASETYLVSREALHSLTTIYTMPALPRTFSLSFP